MARFWRGQNDPHKYNEYLAFIRDAYVELSSHLPKLLTSAENRVNAAISERKNAVVADYNTFEPGWADRTFGSADRTTAKSRSFVRDDKTSRRLEVAGLVPGRDYSDGMGIKASKNDGELEEMATINVNDYREKVEAKLQKDASVLRESLTKLRDTVNLFLQRCLPVHPAFAPIIAVSVHVALSRQTRKLTFNK